MQRECEQGKCPQCYSESGLKYPQNDEFYCEDCGFPDEDFSDDESADLKRIAWLERNKVGVSYNVATQMWETDFESGESFKTARQAIDAAMKSNV